MGDQLRGPGALTVTPPGSAGAVDAEPASHLHSLRSATWGADAGRGPCPTRAPWLLPDLARRRADCTVTRARALGVPAVSPARPLPPRGERASGSRSCLQGLGSTDMRRRGDSAFQEGDSHSPLPRGRH